MIQDAAAKCRFCGEWLDPTKRPDWSQPAEIASSAPPESGGLHDADLAPLLEAQSPALGNRQLDPSATTTDGSLHRPRRRATQTWSAPAWMAHEDEPASDETAEPENDDAVPTLQGTPIEPHRPLAPTVELPAVAAAHAAPPVEHTIDDVADRMRRIKESAAAVREAMLRESDLPQSDVLGDEDPVEAAVTMHAGARSTVRTDDPKPEPPPDVAAMLGDDFDDLDGGDGELDDNFDDLGPARPTATNSRQAGDFTDDDDALPAKGALAGMGFGDDDFNDDDDDDDDDDFDGDFGDVGAGRPIPWKPVAIGAAVVAVLGVGFFWDRIFPPEAVEADPAGEEAKNGEDKPADDGQVAQGSVVPAPGQGQPVVPEGQQPAAVGVAPADPNAVPAPNAAPVDPNAVVDPNAAPVDPNAVVDPNAAPVDPNAAPVDPNAVVAAPAAVPAAQAGASTPLPADAIAVLDEARALWTKAGKKRLSQAKEKLEGILTTHPNSADALLLMAQVQLELGEFDASLETATRCTTVGPQTADCWLTIGVLKQNAKDKPAAANAYERYLALAPEGAYASDAKKQLSRLN